MAEHKIMCMPVTPGSDGGIPGSVQIDADCGHKVWIAPSGLAMVLNTTLDTETVCLRCMDPEELRRAIQAGGMREAPGAREELAAEVGTDRADAALKAFRAKPMGS